MSKARNEKIVMTSGGVALTAADIEKLADAWACIQDHDDFRGIQSAAPLAITDDVADSGSQHPFELIGLYAGACQRLPDLHGRHQPVLGLICNGVPLRACRCGQPRSIRWPEARSGPHARSAMSTLLWPM